MKKRHIGIMAVFAMMVMMGFSCDKSTETATSQRENMPDEEVSVQQGVVVEDSGDVMASDTVMGGMQEMLALGAKKCTWNTEEGYTGVLYTDGTKMRSEAKEAVHIDEDVTQDINMIHDGETIYTWNPQTKMGQEVTMQEIEEMSAKLEDMMGEESDTTEREEFKIDEFIEEEHEFSCEDWNVNDAMFTPPADVTFQDFSEIVDAVNDVMADMAAACEGLSADEKAACEKAMTTFNQ